MDISKNIPDYLVEKRNVTKLVLLTALFALIFMLIYEPFGIREWFKNDGDIMYYATSSLLVIIGMAVIAISRVILYHRCNKSKHGKPLSYFWYYVWIAVEVLCMSVAYCGLIILYRWLRDDVVLNFTEIFKGTFWNTAFALLIPYSILWLYFSWDNKDKRLKAIAEGTAGAPIETPDNSQMTNFSDNKGDVKFSVKLNDIIYIEGADNYIKVFYVDGSKVSTAMIRTSLKQVDEGTHPKGVVRCHRSYMVNTKRIKLLERQKDGFMVKLEAPSPQPILIPVSKAYVKDVYELFG